MKKVNTPLAGSYTPPACEIINIKGEGILCNSASTEDLGTTYTYSWGDENN